MELRSQASWPGERQAKRCAECPILRCGASSTVCEYATHSAIGNDSLGPEFVCVRCTVHVNRKDVVATQIKRASRYVVQPNCQ